MGGAPDELVRLAGEDWAEALTAAPRKAFVPDRGFDAGAFTWIDRDQDPRGWEEAVLGDSAIITQVDDGRTELSPRTAVQVVDWTSSCSSPGVVFAFLRLLDPYPGDRVLEIGTGTGWTAGLLSARLGSTSVTSVEVDERLAATARVNLERMGFTPTLLVVDGAFGAPEGAPYDRLHVTCGVREFPYAWVEQTRPGGIIVAPWMPDPHNFGFRVRLSATGSAAVGRCVGSAGYTMLRAQRVGRPPIQGETRESVAEVDPRRIGHANPGLRLAFAALLPGVSVGSGATNPTDGTYRIALRDVARDSHALATQSSGGGTAQVTQSGPRDLWGELEAAYLAWVGWGEPDMDRFGLTVDAEGQRLWLHHPDNQIQGRFS
ncbi:hypothetical protein J4H86_14735 [Spiractinospora alimapuensis]|uniref:hypothetical protein n=1 Tax=Spiractinospora alimapuensis TaxID=2820884 RepID=UPI001F459580|nr:hypothetical protein [Spiractinospora alimapuensis]QVQ50208.1 hypothetical protein J4H86_14735 [Spiractinospora alimapuensis]